MSIVNSDTHNNIRSIQVGEIKIEPKDSFAWYKFGLECLRGLKLNNNKDHVTCLETARHCFQNAYTTACTLEDSNEDHRFSALHKLKLLSQDALEWKEEAVDSKKLARKYNNDLTHYVSEQTKQANNFLKSINPSELKHLEKLEAEGTFGAV
jgi:hypothetical protein